MTAPIPTSTLHALREVLVDLGFVFEEGLPARLVEALARLGFAVVEVNELYDSTQVRSLSEVLERLGRWGA